MRNKSFGSCRTGRGFHTHRNRMNILRLDICGAWSGRADRARGPARRTDAAGGRMARRMRGRGGARRQHRAASAPQTQARRRRRNEVVRRRPGRARGTRKRDESPWKCGRFPEDKGAADTRTRGRRGDRGRRQSADCRAPAAQGATRARARAATAGNRTRLSSAHTPIHAQYPQKYPLPSRQLRKSGEPLINPVRDVGRKIC